MAMGAATIVSSTSALVLNAVPGRDYQLADDADSFARAVIEIFDDAALRERLGRAGREAVLENYDWSRNLARIDRCFDSGFDRSVDQLFERSTHADETGAGSGQRKRRNPPGPLLATEVEHA